MKLTKLLIGTATALPLAGAVMFIRMADAHYPNVQASATCVDEKAVIRATVESWASDEADHRVNNDIAVYWDGIPVTRGAFTTAGGYKFSFELGVPADGKTHTIRVVAVANFGANAEFGYAGTSRDTTVAVPADCTVTQKVAVLPVAEPKTEVLGTVVTQPAEVAQPIVVLPRFAG